MQTARIQSAISGNALLTIFTQSSRLNYYSLDNYLDVFLAYILDYAANLTQLRLYILSFSVFANRRGQHPTTSERNVELYLEFLFHCIAVKQEEWHTILLMMMILTIDTNTDNNNTNDNNNDNNNDNDNDNVIIIIIIIIIIS